VSSPWAAYSAVAACSSQSLLGGALRIVAVCCFDAAHGRTQAMMTRVTPQYCLAMLAAMRRASVVDDDTKTEKNLRSWS